MEPRVVQSTGFLKVKRVLASHLVATGSFTEASSLTEAEINQLGCLELGFLDQSWVIFHGLSIKVIKFYLNLKDLIRIQDGVMADCLALSHCHL